MTKNAIKDLVRTQVTYTKGLKAVNKAGGIKAARKKLAKKTK